VRGSSALMVKVIAAWRLARLPQCTSFGDEINTNTGQNPDRLPGR
jgi:hypothetical protein